MPNCRCGKPAAKYRDLCDSCRAKDRESRLPRRPCACGCGAMVLFKFKAGHQTRLFTSKEQSRRARFNDGSTQRDRGTKDTYRKVGGRHEHRVVMEAHLGRKLRKDEIVHHKNGRKKDNRISNLELMTQSQHISEHRKDLEKGRHANTR